MILRSLITVFLLYIIGCIFIYNIREIKTTRNDLDYLQESFRKFHDKIPLNSEIHYLSNYNPGTEFTMYFQAQFAAAPNILVKLDTTSTQNKFIVFVTDKRNEFITGSAPNIPKGFDTLDTFHSDNFSVKLFKRIHP